MTFQIVCSSDVMYGSTFVAAPTCVDHIVDLWLTLHYLGVPIREKSYMFGDNKSVVDSSTKPHSKQVTQEAQLIVLPLCT